MKGFWFLMSGAVVVMLLLTPLVIRLRITSWTVGWLAILLGSIAVMALLGLTARLTLRMADRRSLTTWNPDSVRTAGRTCSISSSRS
ncbi:hypothetical protein ACIQVT_00990 [Streptomyces sp. NPDC100445]|uniref:hypothetical protein n=1 Tax=Streptomyces sp. NPDC100445 TaxID=3366102 RepID=UPI0037F8003C